MLYRDFIPKTKTILIPCKTLLKKIQKTRTLLLPSPLYPIQRTCLDLIPSMLTTHTTTLTAIAPAAYTKLCLTLAITGTRTLSTYGVTIGASAAAGVMKKSNTQRSIGQIALC